jgi:transposase
MGLKRTDEFRKDAVRIALTSGLTRKQVANDLGVGMSTQQSERQNDAPILTLLKVTAEKVGKRPDV